MINIETIETVGQQPEPGGAETSAESLRVEVPLEGGADMEVHQVGDRCIIVITAPVTAAECAATVAAVKGRLDAGNGALASHMDDLGMRDALEALAARS